MLCQPGGQVRTRREHAPVGRHLPYRRAVGEGPSVPTRLMDDLLRGGCSVDLGSRGLGDLLLGLAGVSAAADACASAGEPVPRLRYRGPRARLLGRCRLPLAVEQHEGRHIVDTADSADVRLDMVPELPPVWLDEASDDQVDVHAALPMRYYLDLEQKLGVRLPSHETPAPAFESRTAAATPFHVVFVQTTSNAQRKDYGPRGFAGIAARLTELVTADWKFTTLTSPNPARIDNVPAGYLPIDIIAGLDAVDCLEVFATAELVIGNDTGLTHLAALCERPDGTGPQVIGLYGRHGHMKWTTGSARHHAVATRFAQMMSAADACPVRDHLDDAAWGPASDLSALPADIIARFAAERTGWLR